MFQLRDPLHGIEAHFTCLGFVTTRALAKLTILFHAILFHATECLHYCRYYIWHNYLGSNAGSMYKVSHVRRVYIRLMCNVYTTKQWCHCYKLYKFTFRVPVYLVLWCTLLPEFQQNSSKSEWILTCLQTHKHKSALCSYAVLWTYTHTYTYTHTHAHTWLQNNDFILHAIFFYYFEQVRVCRDPFVSQRQI